MKKFTIKSLIAVLAFLFLFQWAGAQSLVASAGLYAEGESGAFSVSIGEVVIGSAVGENMTVTHGFQQSVTDKASSTEGIYLFEGSIYPNPFSDYIIVYAPVEKEEQITVTLYDSAGNLHLSDTFIPPFVRLNTSDLHPGAYLAILKQSGTCLVTKKIIKSPR